MNNSAVQFALIDNHDVSSECSKLTNKIKGAMYDIANSFVYIGFLLAEADEFKTYLDGGYSSIYEYASVELGFKKSSVNNFINVCKTFCLSDSKCGLLYSMNLKDDYKSFNYSQLVEMLSMNDVQRSSVSSDMTIKQLRAFKKNEFPLDCDDNISSFQTSGNSEPVFVELFDSDITSYLGKLIDDFYEDTDDRINILLEDYLLDHLKHDGYVICRKEHSYV